MKTNTRRQTVCLTSAVRRCSRARSRRGSLTMELVLVLPILGILLLGLFEYSLLFFARGEVVDASRTGARIASVTGRQEQGSAGLHIASNKVAASTGAA